VGGLEITSFAKTDGKMAAKNTQAK